MVDQPEINNRRNRGQKLASALGIHPGEGLAASLLLGQAFCMGLALYAFFVAANALFLAEFGAQMIPYVYIVAAVAITAVGVIWSRAQAHVSFGVLLGGTLGLLVVTILGFRLGLAFTSAGWLVFGLMVLLRLLWVLGNLVLFALAGRLFSVRQGKRIFPLISAAAVLAIILGGFATSFLIDLIGTANLLLVSGFALAISLLLLLVTFRKLKDQLASAEPIPVSAESQKHRHWTDLLKTPLIAFLIIYTIMSTLGSYIIDFAFVSEAAANFANADDLARFFGNYLGLSTLINLLFLALLAGRILSRFGIKGGVMANPGLVLLGTLAIVAAALMGAPVGLVFGLVVMTKLFDEVMTTSMTNTSVRVLYQPLAPEQRLSVQGTIESIVAPLALGLSGVLLLLLAAAGNVSLMQVIIMLSIIMVGWVIAAVLLGRSYPGALRQALTKRTLGGGALSLDDGSSIAVLEQQLNSSRPGDIIFAVEMLDQADYASLDGVLVGLLTHPIPAVRRVSLEKIRDRNIVTASEAVAGRMEADDEPSLRALAVGTLCSLVGPVASERVKPYRTDPEPEVRLAAITGLLTHGDAATVESVSGQLSSLEHASLPEDRMFVARVYGDVGGERSIRPIQTLIGDDTPVVRKTALLAAGKVNSTHLWPLVIDALASADTRASARMALEEGGHSVLPFVGRALASTNQQLEVRLALTDVCGKIKGEEAIQLLKAELDQFGRKVDEHVLRTLNACDFRAAADERLTLEQTIYQEIEDITRVLSISQALQDQNIDSQKPLLAALNLELERTRNRILLRLSFLFDPNTILSAGQAIQSGSKYQAANALEALDVLLPRKLKAAVLPLFTPTSDQKRLLQLVKQYPQDPMPLEQQLAGIIEQEAQWSSAWPRACALYAIAEIMPAPILDQAVKLGLADSDPVIREAAVWALSHSPDPARREQLEIVQDDPDPRVARLTRRMMSADPNRQGDQQMLLTIEKVLVLKSVSIFSTTPEDILVDVTTVLDEVEVKAGETILTKGDIGNSMYIVVEGQVRVHDGERTLNFLGAREVFGEMAVLDSAPRVASVTATEDTQLLRLDQAPFYELMENRIEIVRGILQVFSGYVRDRVQDVAALDAQLQQLQQ